ncbi:putative esterase PIR7A [Canna indica]|uniref:Esterase PIR7A n=1 Tax=Canna indica TaxID=4628 RepID=A0AAQ3JVV9_9LILI|nr:putative esterase PIR7A [Canna indica]
MAEEGGRNQRHFVLVHGFGHGAWCWYKLVPLLRLAGHRVTAIDLAASGTNLTPLDDLNTDGVLDSIDDLKIGLNLYLIQFRNTKPLLDVLAAVPEGERVVLVGHSFGGVGLALAMETFPEKIAAAIFATAMMPSPSNSMASIFEKLFEVGGSIEDIYLDSTVVDTQDQRGPLVTFGIQYLSTRLYQLSPPQDLALATFLVRPGLLFVGDLSSNFTLTENNYGSVKRAFIVVKQDQAIVEDFQLWMVEQSPPAKVKEIDCADHMVMISKPNELCNVLVEIAEELQ